MDMNKIKIEITPKQLVLLSTLISNASHIDTIIDKNDLNELYNVLLQSELIDDAQNDKVHIERFTTNENQLVVPRLPELPTSFNDVFDFNNDYKIYMDNKESILRLSKGNANQIGIHYAESGESDESPISSMYICSSDAKKLLELFKTIDTSIFIPNSDFMTICDKHEYMYTLFENMNLNENSLDIIINSVKDNALSNSYYMISFKINIPTQTINKIVIKKIKYGKEVSTINLNYNQFKIFKNFISYHIG